jgi:heme A synthase
MTTTVDTFLVVLLCIWAFLSFPKEHAVRLYALLSFAFLLVEALLGAGLVLFRYVASDQSAGRAWYLSAHLTNTLLMLATMAATAWLASNGERTLNLRAIPGTLWIALVVTALVGITGVIVALGDMLFPTTSLAAGLKQDVTATQMLLRLRLLHPVIALGGAAYLLFVASRFKSSWVAGLTILQICAGMVNYSLMAPVWMQITHLFIADALWISIVLAALGTLRRPARSNSGVLESLADVQHR